MLTKYSFIKLLNILIAITVIYANSSILVNTQVTEYNSFWEYCNKTLLPSLWPDEWYDGVIRDEGFAADRNSFRVGVPRLRQLRIDGGERLTF